MKIYEPRIGEPIFCAAARAIRMAKACGKPVRLPFNDSVLYATPKKSPYTIVWEYRRHCDTVLDRYIRRR